MQKNIQTFSRHTHLINLIFVIVLGLAVLGITFSAHVQKAHGQPANNAIAGTIYQVFGADGPAAVRVAECESSMNPNATNSTPIGGSHAAGLFQILYPSTWYTTSQGGHSPYEATANIIAAHEIFLRDGHSWREWVCQP